MTPIFLPFPPSVNGAYAGHIRRYKSKAYKQWLDKCPELPALGIDYPVGIKYTLFMPDAKKRDISNYIKLVEDYMVNQGVLIDDNHEIIQRVEIIYGGIDRKNARIEICLRDMKSE